MASRRLKRPSSARRNIKQETFTSFVSGSRLRKVQNLLSQSEPGLEGILCILGIDSRYNEGCRELVNYMLFGFFDVRKNELEKSGYADEVLDDIMFLIQPDCVHVYCNPVNYLYLLPYIGSWRNLRLHCLKEEQYDDNEEEAEEFKIHSFLSMIKGFSRVGVPFSRSGEVESVSMDKMVVEKWPIVQAFALEDFGGGGFFTMQHEVVDVSHHLSRVYDTMDPVAVEHLVCETLPLFERQWSTMMSTIDVEARNSGLLNLTEVKVSEPLQSFFNHGRVGDHSKATRRPYVLFGTNSSKAGIEKASPSSKASLDCTGVLETRAKHMVCCAVSARSPISCVRTYFLGLNHSHYQGNTDAAPPISKDMNVLHQVYTIVVDVVLELLQVYASTLSCNQTRSKAVKLVQDRCALLGIDITSSDMKFAVEAFDNHGHLVPLVEGQSSPYVKSASLTLYNIPSLEHPGKTLGSVSFSEAFLDSSIHVTEQGQLSTNAEYVVLTAHIPRYTSWMISKQELDSHQRALHILKTPDEKTYGKTLVHGATVDILSLSNLASIHEVNFYVFEEAVVFVDHRYGCFCLPKKALTDIKFYDGDSTSTVVLLLLSYSPTVSHTLPYHLRSDDCKIIVALTPKTKAYKEFMSEVLHLWKHTELSTQLEILEILPAKLNSCHRQLQDKFQVASRQDSSPLKRAGTNLPDLHLFLDHISVSSVGPHSVPKSVLPILLKQPCDNGSFETQDELVITIISGVPGSFREDLAQTLTNLNKEQQRWMVLRHPVDNVDMFDQQGLQRTLSSAVQTLKKKVSRPGVSRKKMRALVVTPGFTDIVDVVSCILRHPDKETLQHLKIGSVTVCLDPLNTFMENKLTLPKLLDQCAQGWVNNVLFTGSTNLKNEALLETQSLIRAVNSDVAFLLADKGQVTRSPDIELILSETAFTENDMARSRYLSCPGWESGKFTSGGSYPPMVEICLRFPQPLEKNKFTTRLRGLCNSLTKYPFSSNIYTVRGQTCFSESPKKKMEVHYVTLSNILQITSTDIQPKPPSAQSNGDSGTDLNSVVFTGCRLEESRLKDWLRSCGKQKPEKKATRTRSSLSAAELKNIETKHHLDTLPEGWFYNGNQYVSMMGDKQSKHPNLEQNIRDYIEGMNRLIEESNAKIDAQKYPDLFQQ